MATGQHKIEFEALEGWDRLPEGYAYVEVAGVACDSHDRVYVFNRGAYPVIVFDKEGKFLNAWGKGVFKNPHGIFIDRQRFPVARGRQGPHGPQVHGRRRAPDDDGRIGQSLRTPVTRSTRARCCARRVRSTA